MADTSISGFTELTAPASNDMIEILDVSDTTGGASGTNKKVTPSNYITKAHGLSDGIVKVATGTMSIATATGSGDVVLATSPTLITPVLGTATATKITITGASGSTVTLCDAVTNTPNTIVVSASDSQYVYGLTVSAVNTNATATSGVIGLSFSARSTQTLNATRNVYGIIGNTSLTTIGITQEQHYGVVGYGTGFISSGSSTISDFHGVFGSPFTVLGGSITVTRNFAAGFNGDVAMYGSVALKFSSALGTAFDTNLYRSAADTLKTDDAFVSASTITGASSLTLGAAGGSTGSVIFTGTTSGAVTLKAADAAGSATFKLPTADGTNGQFMKTDGAGQLSFATISGGGDALTTNPLSQFAATTSLQLKGVISDETGSGALVFADTPTLVTPILGTPTSGTLTNCSGLPLSGVVDSTTEALGVGSIELGHASDTTIGRLSPGVAGIEGSAILTAASGANLFKRQMEFIIGDGTNVITTGEKKTARVQIPVAGTITGWTIISLDDTSGSITLDVWKDTYANYPPTVADTITASAKPSVTTATKNTNTTLTGWTTSITAGDILSVNVDSVTSFKAIKLIINYTVS